MSSRRRVAVGGHIFIGRTERSPHSYGKERALWLSFVSEQHSSAGSSASSSAPHFSRSPSSRRSPIRSSSSFFSRPRARSSVGSARRTSPFFRPASSNDGSRQPPRAIWSEWHSEVASG